VLKDQISQVDLHPFDQVVDDVLVVLVVVHARFFGFQTPRHNYKDHFINKMKMGSYPCVLLLVE
jgi:hypothetical protein